MNKRKAYVIGISAFLIISTLVYIFLGGMAEVKVKPIKQQELKLVGRYYEGRVDDDSLRNLFFHMKDKVTSGDWDGVLTLAYYNHPEQDSGKVQNFVGVMLNADQVPDTSAYEERVFSSPDGFLQASIDAHPMVRPSPKTVEEKLQDYAKKHGEKVDSIRFEQYLSERKLQVWVPVHDTVAISH